VVTENTLEQGLGLNKGREFYSFISKNTPLFDYFYHP